MKKATKISADKVKLETIYYTKAGSPVVVSSQEFVKDHIEEMRQSYIDQVAYWNSVNAANYIADQLKEPQKEETRYTKLKQAVDGNIGDVVIIEPD